MSKSGKVLFTLAGLSILSFVLVRYIAGMWVPYLWIALGFFAISVVFAVIIDFKKYKNFFSLKTTKHGMSMGVMILLFLILVLMINFLGVRYSKTFDFSVSKINSLADQSVKVAKSIDSPMKVYFFYKKGVESNEENRRLFRELVKKYQDFTTQITFDFIEVNERPDIAKEFGVDRGSGVAFISYKGRKNRIDRIDEQDFTNALIKVTKEKVKKVYYVSGHGEFSLSDSKEATGTYNLKVLLENNQYDVQELYLNQQNGIPKDADLVIIAGSKYPYQNSELSVLENYLKSGGSVLLALEGENAGSFNSFLNKVGVLVEPYYVVNTVNTPFGVGVSDGPTLGVTFSQQNPVTQIFSGNEPVVFRVPGILKRSPKFIDGVNIEEIIKTGKNTYAFKDINYKQPGGEGELDVAMSIDGTLENSKSEEANKFRLLVFADADFLSNQLIYQYVNRDLVLNSVAYLGYDEGTISISAKEPQISQFFYTDTKHALFMFVFAWPLVGILMGTSAALWFRRRNA